MTRRSSDSDLPLRDWQDRELNDSKDIQVHVQEQLPDSEAEIYWQPGIKSRFPWFGFGALLTMLLCASMTIVILRTSSGKVAETWPAYQQYEWIKESWRRTTQLTPSTALAMVNTVYNVALAVAIGNGVAIAWWRKALHGATVKDLHYSWAYSTSVFELATAGRNFNLIALCALTAKLALVDNVLLQRATSTTADIYYFNTTDIRLPIVKELPPNFVGTFSADGQIGSLSDTFSQDLYSYFTSSDRIEFDTFYENDTDSYQEFDTRCGEHCFFEVRGFGANVSCSDDVNSAYKVTPQIVAQSNDTTASNETDINLQDATSTLMSISFNSYVAGTEGVDYPDPWIGMNVRYAELTSKETSTDPAGITTSTEQTCEGQLKHRKCTIRPALVTYGISLTNKSQGVAESRFIYPYKMGILSPAYQTNSSVYEDITHSLWRVLSNSFQTTVRLQYLEGTGFTAQSDSGGFMGEFWAQAQSYGYFPSSCAITVYDPVGWLEKQIDSILLRAALSAAIYHTNDAALNRQAIPEHVVENISGQRAVDSVQYTSDLLWMAAALSLMAICIICVLPTYWGFWELGRRVTLGPMEIASAFQAPALDSSVVAAGGEVEQMLKEVGQREVRYGVVVGSGKLAMGEARDTVKLKPGVPVRGAGDL